MSRAKALLLLLAGVVLAASFLFCQLIKDPYLVRDISGPVTISNEWVELTPDKPLKPEREIHEVLFDFAEPVSPVRETLSVRLADGSAVRPEVRLVDEQGNEFYLTARATSERVMSYSMRDVRRDDTLPKDRVYRSVRLRSDKPLKLSRVYWRCYNPWDMK